MRTQFATKAVATAAQTSSSRRGIDSRFNSPKSSPIMSEVWSERTPLHASFTPTSPVFTRITLPSSCAGIPQRFSVSDAMEATTRIRPCTIGTSMGATQGTATKINATGNAKCVSHGLPPIFQIKAKVTKTAIAACNHSSGRQSGFPISKRRSGNSTRRAEIETNAAIACRLLISNFEFRISIAGRSCQRSQKRYAAKNGTNQP